MGKAPCLSICTMEVCAGACLGSKTISLEALPCLPGSCKIALQALCKPLVNPLQAVCKPISFVCKLGYGACPPLWVFDVLWCRNPRASTLIIILERWRQEK